MFKEKVNARTHTRQTQDHDISPAGLWPVVLKIEHTKNKALTLLLIILCPQFAHLRGFHDDRAKNVTSRVKLPHPPGSHVIQLTRTIFELNSHIKETNVLTKFHENWAKNVTSRKNAPPTGGHVFSPIWTIFELVRDINKTNVLTNFHDDWAKIVTSRVFTRKTAPPPSSHVIQLTGTIFELNSYIKETNKNAPPTGGHVFSQIWTIFELNSHIKETNVLTKFHEHWAKNVTSRVFTCFHYIHIEKNAPPTGGHVFSLN
ncbi:hypothetical protein DPMN_118823 [Dreissena polymorpha]|uniref:Uncharacterized protein n=1 Tax=Dreissena polymorpha TaxID=45954 RepID=A0A9D4GLE8_DREPO|nr:hypothetical protein DPMN_118823 [Dreissena polymorpha]